MGLTFLCPQIQPTIPTGSFFKIFIPFTHSPWCVLPLNVFDGPLRLWPIWIWIRYSIVIELSALIIFSLACSPLRTLDIFKHSSSSSKSNHHYSLRVWKCVYVDAWISNFLLSFWGIKNIRCFVGWKCVLSYKNHNNNLQKCINDLLARILPQLELLQM